MGAIADMTPGDLFAGSALMKAIDASVAGLKVAAEWLADAHPSVPLDERGSIGTLSDNRIIIVSSPDVERHFGAAGQGNLDLDMWLDYYDIASTRGFPPAFNRIEDAERFLSIMTANRNGLALDNPGYVLINVASASLRDVNPGWSRNLLFGDHFFVRTSEQLELLNRNVVGFMKVDPPEFRFIVLPPH